MLIACTNCETSYQVAPSSLGPTGRSVRCVRCRQVWFAANTDAMAEIAQSHRDDVVAWAETDVAPPYGGLPSPPGMPPRALETLAEPEPAKGRKSGCRGKSRFPDGCDPAGRHRPGLGTGTARRCRGDRGGGSTPRWPSPLPRTSKRSLPAGRGSRRQNGDAGTPPDGQRQFWR